jgi:hypothetical protein
MEQEGKGKVFFSEEKKQKTFVLAPAETYRPMAGILGAAKKQRSFLRSLTEKGGARAGT